MSMLSIGVSGLNAANVNLSTVSHNITNSSTTGYSRQVAMSATNTALSTGAGDIGQGTHVTTVVRLYNSYLTKTLNATQATSSELDSYYTQLSKIDNMLSDTTVGLSTATDDFFSGVNDAATNPSVSSSRQSMISSAQSLSSRYQALDDQLQELYSAVNTQITSTVESINTYAGQIASMNSQIVNAQAANNQPANDLLDKRDELVSELNKLVGVTVSTESNGSYDVFFGKGQQLVVGTQVTEMTVEKSASDPSRLTVGQGSSAGSQELPESLITGGSLGGLLKFRSESLDKTSNQLGLNATALAMTFNAQYALGQDENGAVAGETGFESDFFTYGSGKVIADSNNDATATPDVTITLSAPSYDSTSGNFYSDLTGSDYSVYYDGSDLTLTRLSDNYTWTATGASDVSDLNAVIASDSEGSQGFTFDSASLTAGTPARYLVEPTRGAANSIGVNSVIAADTTLVALAAPMRTATGSSNSGTATISDGTVSTGYTALADGYPITLTYDSTSNTFSWGDVYASDGTTVIISAGTSSTFTSGDTITVGGNNVVISGTPANGDTFTIERNSSGSSDSRNALALVAQQNQNTMLGGTATYQENYATLVSYVGNKTNELSVTSDAQDALVTQASDAVESLSGVNLDEEAANLIKYQEAYQASAKVIQTASDLFDTILGMMN